MKKIIFDDLIKMTGILKTGSDYKLIWHFNSKRILKALNKALKK